MRNSFFAILFLLALSAFVVHHASLSVVHVADDFTPNLKEQIATPKPASISVSQSPTSTAAFAASHSTPMRATPENSQTAAVAIFPSLGVAGSPFNRAYIAKFHRLKRDDPTFFNDPAWPLALARQIASETKGPISTSSNSVATSSGGSGILDLTTLNIISGEELTNINLSSGTPIPTTPDMNQAPASGSGTFFNQIDFKHQLAVAMFIFGTGGIPQGEYKVEWFFIGKDIHSGKRWIYDNGSRDFACNCNIYAVSSVINETRIDQGEYSFSDQPYDGNTNLVTVNITHRIRDTGYKPEGWVVRLKKGDTVDRIFASLNELQEYAQHSQSQLDEIAKTPTSSGFVASYNRLAPLSDGVRPKWPVSHPQNIEGFPTP